jgi:Arc/MetJ-type ribon-helix-helix transcriptional regulator
MEIAISSDDQRLIEEHVSLGHYSSPEAAVAAALQLLRQRDNQLSEEEYKMVKEGLDAIERGEYRVLETPEDYEALHREICEGSKKRRSG